MTENPETAPVSTPLISRRPRVVTREKIPTDAFDAAVHQEITYFVLGNEKRLEPLKERIESLEKQMFDFEITLLILDGNPGGPAEHHVRDDQPESHRDEGYNPICPCMECEMVRVKKLLESATYGHQKLRALYSRLTNA